MLTTAPTGGSRPGVGAGLIAAGGVGIPARRGCEFLFQLSDKPLEPLLGEIVFRRVEKPPRQRQPVFKFPANAF
jgi:hypothetical protein